MLTLYFTCSFRLKFATNNSSSGSWSADTAEAGRRSLCALCMTCPHPDAAGTKYSTSMGWFRYRFLSGRRGIDNAKLVKCGCLTVDYIRLGLGGWLGGVRGYCFHDTAICPQDSCKLSRNANLPRRQTTYLRSEKRDDVENRTSWSRSRSSGQRWLGNGIITLMALGKFKV